LFLGLNFIIIKDNGSFGGMVEGVFGEISLKPLTNKIRKQIDLKIKKTQKIRHLIQFGHDQSKPKLYRKLITTVLYSFVLDQPVISFFFESSLGSGATVMAIVNFVW